MMLTRKETRGILREWKSFLTEAAAEPKNVEIYDFDSTLVSLDLDSDVKQSINYFSAYLRPYAFAKLSQAIKLHTVNVPLFDQFKAGEANKFKDTYIVCQINSGGFSKGIDVLVGYLMNEDIKFLKFLKLLVGIDISGLTHDDEGDEEGDDDYLREAKGDVKDNSDSDQSLFIAAAMDGDQEAARKLVGRYFRFELPSSDAPGGDTSIDIKWYQRTKKRTIMQILDDKGVTGFPNNHIIMCSNMAESKTGTTGTIIKGSSGKYAPGVALGKKYPEASFKIYDNQVAGLGQMKKGLLAARLGANNHISAEIDRLTQEYAAETKRDRKAEIKAELDSVNAKLDAALNVETYQVKDGEPVAIYKPLTGKSATSGANIDRQWRSVRENAYANLFYKKGTSKAENLPEMIKIMKDFPNASAVINDIIDKPADKQNLKRLLKKLPDDKFETTVDFYALDDKGKNEVIDKAKAEISKLIPIIKSKFKGEEETSEPAQSEQAPVEPIEQPATTTQPPEGQLAEWRARKTLKESLRNFKLVLKSK